MDSNHRSVAYETTGDDQTPPLRYIRATQFVLLYAVCHGELTWSEYKDSNLGPPGPKPGALARLRHTPNIF